MDIGLNSHSIQADFGDDYSKATIALDEFEKSVFLTKAQDEIFLNLYNGKNVYGDFFEGTEELRRYLDNLVRTKVYKKSLSSPTSLALVNLDSDEITEIKIEKNPVVSTKSKLFRLPADLAFITMEQVTYSDDTDSCKNGFTAKVYPITQDEYANVKDNPFRGPTKYKVLRLDYGKRIVELIPADGYVIGEYLIKYLKRPNPIILTDLPNGLEIHNQSGESECEMDETLHNLILDRAIALAVQSKMLGANNNKNRE